MDKYFYKMKDKDSFDDHLLLSSSALKMTKTMNSFGTFKFMSRTGEIISAKRWNISSIDDYKADEVYHVKGVVEVYNGVLSLVISSIEPSEVNSDQFPRENPFTTDELKKEFKRYYCSIGSLNLAKVIEFTINKLDTYFESKAAKNIHHDFKGGLAYHSLTMANLADTLSRRYDVDRDLLVTAAILHDAGKTIELDNDGYTKEGILYGHIIIMNDILSEAIFTHKELADAPEIAHLKHILLSHHGRLEWGSPVLGATPEAILFHHIDKIDADMQIAKTELAKVNPGTPTPRIWALDNRVLYNIEKYK